MAAGAEAAVGPWAAEGAGRKSAAGEAAAADEDEDKLLVWGSVAGGPFVEHTAEGIQRWVDKDCKWVVEAEVGAVVLREEAADDNADAVGGEARDVAAAAASERPADHRTRNWRKARSAREGDAAGVGPATRTIVGCMR